MMICFKRTALILLLSLVTMNVAAQLVAVRTNVLMLAAEVPNLGVEMVTGERSTIGFDVFATESVYWADQMKIVGIQPEYRYWFNGRPMTREFIGLGLLATTYKMGLGNHVYDGDAGGAGVTFGYCFNLTKRLNIEAHAGVGAIFYRNKEYYKHDNLTDFEDLGVPTSYGLKVWPIKIGVSVSYILK